LRDELQKLETDLARGTPISQALKARHLPSLYVRMVEIGVRSNDLPGTLTQVADYYHRANSTWTRLKGLMVYPLIVVMAALGLSLLISVSFRHFLDRMFDQVSFGSRLPFITMVSVWIPPVLLSLAAGLGVVAVTNRGWRSRLRWRLPAFREASLAQLASSMALMLRNGTPLPDALALAESLESGTAAGKALGTWRALIAGGEGKPQNWPAANPFPPLFIWLVQQSREDPASGFQKAADIYQARASYRIELALYGILPVSIILLGQMIFWQAAPLFQSMSWLMNTLGSMGD
jgi:type II secretory pathway component PulF